jgi:WhiB family transcriptional regulator, redox-sensing transcriptional regulator
VTLSPTQLTRELVADWRVRAACSAIQHSLFFPLGDTDQARIDQAKAICADCAVTDDCLRYALETNQQVGIWGGTTEAERKSLRRKWMAGRRRS